MNSVMPMAPFERPLRPPLRPASHELQADIDVAAAGTFPVLITAPPGCASVIVQAIAARSHRDVIPVPAASHDLLRAIADERLGIRTRRRAILWLEEVHELTPAHQAAVMKLVELGAAQPQQALRIIASSSADLMAMVERGSFDDNLFYRLNAIHVVVREGSE